jgi:hypothetical protein
MKDEDSPRSRYFCWTHTMGCWGPLLKIPLLLVASALPLVGVGLVSSALFVLALALFVLLLPLLSIAGTYLASFMPFNDFYTKILLLSYKSLLFSRTRPVAKEFRVTVRRTLHPVLAADAASACCGRATRHGVNTALIRYACARQDLRPKRRLSVVPIAYALDIAIPKGAEEEFSPETTPSFTSRLSVWIEENLYRLPYFVNNERFGPNEGTHVRVGARRRHIRISTFASPHLARRPGPVRDGGGGRRVPRGQHPVQQGQAH